MQPDGRARHAGSFGAVAADYDAARPSYPGEAVGWLTGPAPLDVLDLGAGTGRLTELLAAEGHRVTAVDPSTEMLDALRRRLPDVATVVGSAENIALPTASMDVVTAAQAWHWFDRRAAPQQCARLLRPGGRLGLVWNERDRSVDWVRAVWEPLDRDKDGGTGMALLTGDWQRAVTDHGEFEAPDQAVFRYEQQLSRGQLLQLVGSRSAVAVLEPVARATLLAEVVAIVDTHPDTRGRETFVLPYDTLCFAWRRT